MARLPNILWIVTTQWRAQAVGYAGDVNVRTPQLDRLAAESLNYSQAVTPHPFGPFARAAMLTGLRSPENGLTTYFDPLPVGTRTIAHDLEDRGYETAFFGKWHLGERDPLDPLVGDAHAKVIIPVERRGGFRFWEGFESGFLLNDPWLHGSRLVSPEQFAGYQSDVVCRRAAEFLATRASSRVRKTQELGAAGRTPWFAMVSLEAPHPPYDAPSAGVAPSDVRQIQLRLNVPRGGSVEEKARRELAGYYAHIEATDRAIGQLLAPIREEETIVVFTSVHGDMHGSHGLFRKGWPYEESVRVPFLVRGPHDQVGHSSESDAAVSLVDLRKLTVTWAEGRPPVMDRPYSLISMPSVVALPHQCDRQWRGLRTISRKLVLNAEGIPWLFFDLQRDPLELENLVNDPARAAEIEELRTTR
jgi:arylsulfatase A-like enzyme